MIALLLADYDGDPFAVLSVKNSYKIGYDCGDDPFESIINSKIEIGRYNQGQIDILELQLAGDRDIKVEAYIADTNTLYWTGYLIPDGIQNYFRATPYELNLTATDGLKLLQDVDFNHVEGVYTNNDIIVSIFSNLRSEEHKSELQSLMRISYAVFCLKKKHETSNN